MSLPNIVTSEENLSFLAWHPWKWFHSSLRLLVPPYPGFCSRKKKKRKNATHREKWSLFIFCKFILLHTVRSQRKQHVHWSWLGKKSVFSNKPNIYTPHLHVFPLCPVETVLMMAYLTNPVCGLLAACIPREIFHLKVITIVRCGVVLRVESFLFFLNELISTFQTTVISANHHVVQF